MSAFTPRLLVPGASGIPSYIRVSHDAAVYEELADPSVTAVLHVPQWPEPVTHIFDRLARKARTDVLMHRSKALHAITTTPEEVDCAARLRVFLMQHTSNWVTPMIVSRSTVEQIDLIAAITAPQHKLVEVLRQLTPLSSMLSLQHQYNVLSPTHAASKFMFNPLSPANRFAHIDAGPAVLFAHIVGTVLVDQDGLDIAQKNQPLKDFNGGQAYGIAQEDLAGRLWQAPGASCLFMKGGRDKPQYHFFPYAERAILRHKIIGFSEP